MTRPAFKKIVEKNGAKVPDNYEGRDEEWLKKQGTDPMKVTSFIAQEPNQPDSECAETQDVERMLNAAFFDPRTARVWSFS